MSEKLVIRVRSLALALWLTLAISFFGQIASAGRTYSEESTSLNLENIPPQPKQDEVLFSFKDSLIGRAYKNGFQNEESVKAKAAKELRTGLLSPPIILRKVAESFLNLFHGGDSVGEHAVAPFPPAPLMPIPNARQLAWQQGELSMFLHYGMNTYTDKEWGDGTEDPETFDPTGLNATQWATVAKETGFQFLVLVAKHHDGFCAWPSKYTEHSVKNSPWKDGKGDVVREVSDAAKSAGIGFGIYLSPWDQNCSVYGNTKLYNQYYMGQLTELMTNYGPIVYNFYDGAKGSWGKEMEYHYDQIMTLNHQLQPRSAIFSDSGPDVRWVGNEGGWAGLTNWATIDRKKVPIGGGTAVAGYLSTGQEGEPDYAPAECETSIRPAWFWHPGQKPKSLETLLGIYFSTVGRNCHMLLNLPPNRVGLFDDADVTALRGFHKALKQIFSTDFALGGNVTASDVRGWGSSGPFGPPQVLSDDIRTYWATEDDVREATLEVQLKTNETFNVIRLQEPIQLGQRISKHEVQVWDFHIQTWVTLVEGTTIGYKRLHGTDCVITDKVRVQVYSSRACPLLASFGLHYSEHPVTEPPMVFGRARHDEPVSSI